MRFCNLILLCFFALSLPLGWKWARGPAPSHLVKESSGCIQASLDRATTAALSQPFTSWGRGSQSEVFLSQDGKWVLKIPRNKKVRPYLLGRFWHSSRVKSCLNSYRVAGQELAPEAAVHFVHHGDPISMPGEFALIDRLGRKMCVNAGALPFALQRRVHLMAEVLKTETNPEEKKRILSALIDLIAREREKGWVCSDYSFVLNLGYEKGRAFRVDIGSYRPTDESFNWAEVTKPVRHFLQDYKEFTVCGWWDEEIQKRN